jgi:hypothetical protein
VEARVADFAGNTTASGSIPTQTVDVTPGPVGTATLALATASNDGVSTTDNITSIVTPTINGMFTATDATTRTELATGSITATLFIGPSTGGVPDKGDQILATDVPVSTTGTFTADNIPSLTPGSNQVISAALDYKGIYGSSVAGTTTLTISVGGNLTSSGVFDGGQLPVSNSGPSNNNNAYASQTYVGVSAYAGLGYSVTSVGDFNGDGYTDYLVSAPGNHSANVNGAGSSVMYLLYGGPNGLPNVSNLSSLSSTQGITITSSNTNDRGLQGLTVTDIGDFNGDGRDDIAISSNLNDTVYVVYGTNSNPGTINLASMTASQGFSVVCTGTYPAGSFFGQSVTGADLNGDGYSDLVMGYGYNGATAGNAYVIYGGSGGQAGNITIGPLGSNPTTVTGATHGSTVLSGTTPGGLGTDMTAVGDVNGDGYTDYLVTAPGGYGAGGTTPGMAYLIFGGPNGLLGNSGTAKVITAASLATMTASQGITVTSSTTSEHLGGQAQQGGNLVDADSYYVQYHSLSDLGNIGGNGTNYFAIGSPGAINPSSGGEGAGAVYVLPSQVSWSNVTLPTWTASSATWNASSLSSLTSHGGFVIYSQAFANATKGVAATTGSTTMTASDLGFSVSSAGDVNGDGITDFLIGAPSASNGQGAVFLVFGEAGGLPGQSSGAVNLDTLVSAGATQPFGTPGTAVEYMGTITNQTQTMGGSELGTDVTGGNFNGSGISGYAFGSYGQSVSPNVAPLQEGMSYSYNGTTAYLTQSYYNADNQVYYAASGVNHIATGTGTGDWVHGIGAAADSVDCGIGSDYVGIVDTKFMSITGGTSGSNTLVFEQSGLTLNLTSMGLKVQNFGTFDLDNQSNDKTTDPEGKFTGTTTGNTLQLSLSDVLSENGGPTHPITILGSSSSTVQLDGTSTLSSSNWYLASSKIIGTTPFDVYQNHSSSVAQLLIEHGVNVI